MMVRLNQEEGRYRVLLIGIGDNTEEEKEVFCDNISKNYSIPLPLLRKIVDRSPLILKKNLSFRKAEMLAKTLKSFGATVAVEERRNFPPVSLEFQELVPHRLALESSCLRKAERGTWSVIGRARNISDEALNDIWVLVQFFDDLGDFTAFEENPLPINPLPSGEASPFKVIFAGDFPVKRISVAFKSASGEPVPTVDERKKREWVRVETEDGDERFLFSSSRSTGFEEKPQVSTPTESEEKRMLQEKDTHPEALSEEKPVPDRGEEAEKPGGGETETIPEENLSPPLEPPQKIEEPFPGFLEEDGRRGEEKSESAFGDETFVSEELEEAEEGLALCELQSPSEDREAADTSHLDVSVFEQATQLLEDISEGEGEAGGERKAEERQEDVAKNEAAKEEEAPSFAWIEAFRDSVESFYQKPRDIFSIWFEECRRGGEFEDSLHALLNILVHSRFDEGNRSIKALENTQRVFRLILRPNVLLDEIPPLEGTPFVSGEVWRDLFHRALPKVQQIGRAILEKNKWSAFNLQGLIQVIPHMGYQSSRMAIRWINELIPDLVEVDFSEAPVTVGEGLYRVASRLGVVDPHFDCHQGRNSMGDAKIQSFAKLAFPRNPLEIEEPMTWMGSREERGGHCFPVQPRCDGCLFESFCAKLYVHFNPSEKGMRE